jgi:hypothetical protein
VALRPEREVSPFQLELPPTIAQYRNLEASGPIHKEAIYDITGSTGREHEQDEGCNALKAPGIQGDTPPFDVYTLR